MNYKFLPLPEMNSSTNREVEVKKVAELYTLLTKPSVIKYKISAKVSGDKITLTPLGSSYRRSDLLPREWMFENSSRETLKAIGQLIIKASEL